MTKRAQLVDGKVQFVSAAKDEMRAEYRREDLGKLVRGKFCNRVSQARNLLLLNDKVGVMLLSWMADGS